MTDLAGVVPCETAEAGLAGVLEPGEVGAGQLVSVESTRGAERAAPARTRELVLPCWRPRASSTQVTSTSEPWARVGRGPGALRLHRRSSMHRRAVVRTSASLGPPFSVPAARNQWVLVAGRRSGTATRGGRYAANTHDRRIRLAQRGHGGLGSASVVPPGAVLGRRFGRTRSTLAMSAC